MHNETIIIFQSAMFGSHDPSLWSFNSCTDMKNARICICFPENKRLRKNIRKKYKVAPRDALERRYVFLGFSINQREMIDCISNSLITCINRLHASQELYSVVKIYHRCAWQWLPNSRFPQQSIFWIWVLWKQVREQS